MQALKSLFTGATLIAAVVTSGCTVFEPVTAEQSRALEAYARWTTPGAKPAMTMADMIDMGMVHRPQPCDPLQPTCVIMAGSVQDTTVLAGIYPESPTRIGANELAMRRVTK